MVAWGDSATIQPFLPQVAEQIQKLFAGKPKYAVARGAAIPSTVPAKSI
jgi:hypothetical protein